MPIGIFKNPIERAKKISKALKGRFISSNSGFQKGHKVNLGKKYSEKHKEKLRISHNPKSNFNLTRRFKKGNVPWNKGKGIKTLLAIRIRSLLKYRQWHSDIFTRDDFTCQKCGKRGGKIIVHHLVPFVEILKRNKIETIIDAENCEELWNINNGRTLCKDCHKYENK